MGGVGNAAEGVGTVTGSVTGGTETLTGSEGLGGSGTDGNVVGTVPVIGPIGELGSGIAGPAAGGVTPRRPRSACVSCAGEGEWLTRTEAVTTPAATITLACATWRHLIHRRWQMPQEVEEPATSNPNRQEIDDLACRGLSTLDMSADRGHRDLQHSLDGVLIHAEVFCDLLVREPAEVSKLDRLLLAGRQRIQRFVHSLADHCGREVVPGQ